MLLPREITNAILACIRGTLTRCLNERRDEKEEVWLSKDEFLKQFQMFTEGWLKDFGESLPRSAAVITDKDGATHATRWAYPRNQIQSMIKDGRIKQLTLNKK